MKVYGTEITQEQLDAGRAAMRGTFTMHQVILALVRAGVPHRAAIPDRAADRLLQSERKAGRIKVNPDNKREWIAKEEA